jgi:hypothetical protein
LDGFGTVFDGEADVGHFANMSTQAVLDLIKNAYVGKEESGDGHVYLAVEDVDQFDVSGVGAQAGIGNSSGECFLLKC